MPPAVPSPAPALSALKPHQLATRLSLTTPRPGPELGNTRDYTVFDMADAVVTVTAPPENTLDEGADPRLSNHRPRFVTYSEAAPRRVREPQSPQTRTGLTKVTRARRRPAPATGCWWT